MKILSPVGNFESLKMAVYYGADEVYLGVKDFNARNNIEGFSVEDLDEVVFFAHINNVKINLAVNILFRDDELSRAVELVVKAYNKGVDSFIVQDLGLVYLLHKFYPEIEIHASTQMGLHNLEGVKQAEKLGFKRVVLARETPLDEIKRIRENTKVEIEYFAQGALCVCFSGNCYLSSYLCDASGNRGKCKQLCRLPYELQKDGKTLKSGYLLSAKDFNMLQRLDDFKNAGVDVLKIEGRARRPFYVAMTTKQYAQALKGEKTNQDDLKLAFNREYTAGYFDGNGKIISHYNNHIGVEIGKVTAVKIGKKFNEVFFSSNKELSQKSSIKLFNKQKEEVSTIALFDLKKVGKNLYVTTTTQKAGKDNFVNLISDFDLEQTILKYSKNASLDIVVKAFSGKKLYAETEILGQKILFKGEVLEKAKSQPMQQSDIEKCFEKNEYFCPQISFETDGVFASKSILNEFRRNFYTTLKLFVLNNEKHNLKLKNISLETENVEIFGDFEIAERVRKFAHKNVIYSPEIYDERDILAFREICKKENRKMYLDLPNFALKKDIAKLQNIVEKNNIPVIVNNLYGLDFECEKIAGGGLNVFNKTTVSYLGLPVICAEDCFVAKTNFPYMTLRHCPFKCDLGVGCDKCPYSDGYALKMQNGKVLKIKRKKLSTCTFYLTD